MGAGVFRNKADSIWQTIPENEITPPSDATPTPTPRRKIIPPHHRLNPSARWAWALNAASSVLGSLDEIQVRFLDGLSWHSDAISEPDLGARIVKFWTAIERVLSTSHTSKISVRAAVLSSYTFEDFHKRSQNLSEVYQKRNDVVHGSANRGNESWYVEASVASEEASKTTLFQYLYAIPQILAGQGPGDRKKLQAWLMWLDKIAEQHRKESRGK